MLDNSPDRVEKAYKRKKKTQNSRLHDPEVAVELVSSIEKQQTQRSLRKNKKFESDDELDLDEMPKLDVAVLDLKQEQKLVELSRFSENEQLKVLLNINDKFSWKYLDPNCTNSARPSPCKASITQ